MSPNSAFDALLPAAHAERLRRVDVALQPGGFIEAVDGLLADVVAGEPVEVEPIADLVLHAAPLRVVASVPELAGVVVRLDRDDIADRLVFDDPRRTVSATAGGIASTGRKRRPDSSPWLSCRSR